MTDPNVIPCGDANQEKRVNAPKCGSQDFETLEDEYGSLADGGSYARYRCNKCGRIRRVQFPD